MADDTSSGGLSGAIGGLAGLADPQLLMSLGMGLMAGSRYGSNAGEGLLQGLQTYQGLKTNQLQRQLMGQQIQQGQLGLDWQKALQGARIQALGGTPGQSGAPQTTPASGGSIPAPSASPFYSGISQMPQNGTPPLASNGSLPQAPNGTPPQGQNGYWEIPTPQSVDQATFPGELMPRQLARVSVIGDPKVQDELEKSHYLAAQRMYGSQMNTLKFIAQSGNPGPLLAGAPALRSKFGEWAQAAGVDPNSTDPQDLRHVATYAYNQYAGSLGGEALPVQNALTKQGLDPISGKYEGGEPQKVIGANGQPINVRPQDAIGRTPFAPSLFGAGSVTDQALENDYQKYLVTGQEPNYGRNLMMQARAKNYIAQRMAQDNVTPAQAAATGQQFKATQGVVKDFESGATSKVLNGLNTSIQHMAALDPVIDAMGNGNVTLLNKATNYFKQQTGNPAPTNFAALKEFVSGEVAKAVLPGGGGEAERKALADPINAANSPAQLKQAVQIYKTALAGKTEALRNQWEVGTGGAQGSFDKFLLPETKKALGIQNLAASGPVAPLGVGQSHSAGGFTITRVK